MGPSRIVPRWTTQRSAGIAENKDRGPTPAAGGVAAIDEEQLGIEKKPRASSGARESGIDRPVTTEVKFKSDESKEKMRF
jgi:hypothetical protein